MPKKLTEKEARELALAFTLPADCPTDVINADLTEEELHEKRENLVKVLMKYETKDVQP